MSDAKENVDPKPALMKAIHLKQVIHDLKSQMESHLKGIPSDDYMVLDGDTVYRCSWRAAAIGCDDEACESFKIEKVQLLR